jgi:hypothetical protein
MKNPQIYIGNCALKAVSGEVKGEIVSIGNEDFYCIRNYDRMKPFLMSIVSNSNHWMYISSKGGLTAGRKNPDNAIFPYYTDDKIHDSSENTGSITLIKCTRDGKQYLWEPFTERYSGIYCRYRNLYKNIPGNKIIFEEGNNDLGIIFRYSWMNSDRFGWIRKSEIFNSSENMLGIEILDGVQNILPYGILRQTQMQFSTLMDAYKKNELIKEANLALYRMSSIPVDRAEPSEALRVTTVWTGGIKSPKILLSSIQLDSFREGRLVGEETGTRGTRGSFLMNSSFNLASGKNQEWIMVIETRQDSSDVQALTQMLKDPSKLLKEVLEDVEKGSEDLRSIVSSNDGIQECADKLVSGRHFSNVLFNVMRGGLFRDAYRISKSDFILHLQQFSKSIVSKHEKWLMELEEVIEYAVLLQKKELASDPELYRLVLEYLPLSFSRRHGDPSRPWNLFSIDIKNEDGSSALSYQGNWRDIFQNWEALAMSYPLYVKGMICKFLNASTADGYNPYRIGREGFDWEIHNPSDPWSNIGYWGDHQIIYLLKLLEISEKFFPGDLETWFTREVFVYANVPYRIKTYPEIIKYPQDSIVFDEKLNELLIYRAGTMGADGKLLTGKDGLIYTVNLAEKLLVSILAKLSNYIPGAGLWMNTQRPEWNDANNALTGYGVSMVSLYHLRRHLEFLLKLVENSQTVDYRISSELRSFFDEVNNCFKKTKELLGGDIDDLRRKEISYQLGMAGSLYRERIYNGLGGEKSGMLKSEMFDFIGLALLHINDTIRTNRRQDGMYHSYNLISIREKKMVIRNLYEMLEGQVSVLGSGYLSPDDALENLNSLRNSSMYRKDQNSYTLYPDRELPVFTAKNSIPEPELKKSVILQSLLKEKNKEIIIQDVAGVVHFNSSFNNASALKTALAGLRKRISCSDEDIKVVLDIYETVFDHQSFTGRSGTFFKYEGLGSIYWHMVSKLLLCTGEIIQRAAAEGLSRGKIGQLVNHYREIQDGIGTHKNPENYGAFTTDPYSHTPSMLGVQQPGMTGQVKEDILSRWIELGITIEKGQIIIRPVLLRKQEFLVPRKESNRKEIIKPYLSFSFCGVPFEYVIDDHEGICVHYNWGEVMRCGGFIIDKETSRDIACRSERILKVQVKISEETLESGKR